MKLSEETLLVLENYGAINANLKLNANNLLVTMNPQKTVFSSAHIAESFPSPFGIYDVKQFLSVLSMFTTPELVFNGNSMNVIDSEDKSMTTKYYSADMSILQDVKALNEETLPKSMADFDLPATCFKRLKNGCGILNLSDIKFETETTESGRVVNAVVYDGTGASKNTLKVTTTENYTGEDFSVHLNKDKFVVIPGDYTVSVLAMEGQPPRAIKLKSKERDQFYVIALDADA